jgi:hypothetical protein
MNDISITCKSIALAHKKLRQMFYGDFDSGANCGRMQANPCKDIMSNISTIPKLHVTREHIPHSDFGIPTDDLIELFARTAKNAYQSMLVSERGKETLSKAYEYKIPFKIQKIDWLDLIVEIEEYELLIEKADKLDLDWNYNYYDPMGLEQAIDNALDEGYLEQQDLSRGYYANLGV